MQIIDLRDTDKSQYFAITESNNCLSFDRQVSFHILITSWQLREVICHFSQRAWLQLRMSRILFAAKHVLNDTTHEQTIICRQLFAGHVVGSWQMERKKTMRRMIIYIKLFFGRRTHLSSFYFISLEISNKQYPIARAIIKPNDFLH